MASAPPTPVPPPSIRFEERAADDRPLEPERGLLRSTDAPARMELEGQDFHAKVADAYLKIAEEHSERFVVVDADRAPAEVSDQVRESIEEHIEKAFDFGGMPARNGVAAATMVAHGFSGVEDVFSGERSFFVAYGRSPRPEELARGLGEDYEILRTNIKRWSVGSPIQAPLDSLAILIKEHGIQAEQVEKELRSRA